MSSIGANLKLQRKRAGISQEELGEKLGVTRQAISNWETGKAWPDLEMLKAIAQALDTDVNTLLYAPGERGGGAPRLVSLWPVAAVAVFFLLLMTVGAGVSVAFFQAICGGGVEQSFLYPIYGGIVALAVLITACTCLILEEIRNRDT